MSTCNPQTLSGFNYLHYSLTPVTTGLVHNLIVLNLIDLFGRCPGGECHLEETDLRGHPAGLHQA